MLVLSLFFSGKPATANPLLSKELRKRRCLLISYGVKKTRGIEIGRMRNFYSRLP